MEIALMVQGQEDVTWEDWLALAAACEENRIATLYRSDHYLSVDDRPGRCALDAWGTICGLAAVTGRLRLGTCVSPVTFRHPAVLAKLAVTADHISGGRVELGIGAGWLQQEHERYGFPLPPIGPLMDLLEEQLQVVRGHWAPGPFEFAGRHFSAHQLDALPKPLQSPLPLILGGAGGPRSLRLAARYADEYNTLRLAPEEAADLRRRLDAACEAEGRDPASLPLSMIAKLIIGEDRGELLARAAALSGWEGKGGDGEALLRDLRDSAIHGTVEQVLEQLRALEAAGVVKLVAQHLLYRDHAAVELIGNRLIPAAKLRSHPEGGGVIL